MTLKFRTMVIPLTISRWSKSKKFPIFSVYFVVVVNKYLLTKSDQFGVGLAANLGSEFLGFATLGMLSI